MSERGGRRSGWWLRALGRCGRRRHVLLPAIILVELLILFAFGAGTSSSPPEPKPSGMLQVFDLSSAPPSPPVAPPPPPPVETVPPPIILTPAPTPVPVTIAPLAPVLASPGVAGPSCDVNGPMLAMLRTDPKIAEMIAAIPRSTRSVANAVQVWNGSWVDAQLIGGPVALVLIQSAVERTLASLPPACRVEPRSGPAFFIVPARGEDVMLVIGSGLWSWSQLDAPVASTASSK